MLARTLKGLASISLAATVALAGSAALATPAHAATGVSFCFSWASGAAYANYPVSLYQVDATGRSVGSPVRTGKSGVNGCGTFFNTPSNINLRPFAGLSAGGHYYAGTTPYWATPGAGTVNVNRGYVTQIW